MKDTKLDISAEDQDLIKALEELGIPLDIKKSMDNEDSEGSEEEKKEGSEEEGEEEEKVEKSIDDEISNLEKALADKKAEKEALKKSMNSEEDSTKSSDLLKSLQDTLEVIIASNDDLKKSLDSMKVENDELRKSIDNIGNQTPGMKSVGKHSYIEKTNPAQDEEGRTVLSVSSQKSMVEDVLMKAMDDEPNDAIKKNLSDNLLAYNAGGAKISEEVAKYLLNSKNVRLVQ